MFNNKRIWAKRFNVATVLLSALVASGVAQAQTAFTYQGKMTETGAPVSGPLDLAFRLYDAAAAGTLIGSEQSMPGFNGFSADGSFTVDLDFGAGAFDGTDRWLEVWVDGAALSPRQPILPAPYAMYALNGGTGGWTDKGADIHTMANVGIGTTTPLYPLDVQTMGVRAISGVNLAPSGIVRGIYGEVNSPQGVALWGSGKSTSGISAGVRGETSSADGYGVWGLATATGGNNVAGLFQSYGNAGHGVVGTAFASSGYTYGVRGQSNSTNGTGVIGQAQAGSGVNYGVYGQTNSTSGFAGYFEGGKNYFEGFVGVGTTAPLDELHVRGVQATLRLEDDDDPGSFTEVMDAQPTQLRINKTNSNGDVLLDLNPKPAIDGDTALVRFFRETDTSGVKGLRMYRGDNTASLSALVGVDGQHSAFQLHGGNFGIGTGAPGSKLHVYHADSGTVLQAQGNGTNTGVRVSNAGIGVQISSLSSTGTGFSIPSISGSARAASFYGQSSNDMFRVWNDGTGPAIQVLGASDVNAADGGLLLLGDVNSANIGIDSNEMMARNNGVPSTLLLNREGGNVAIGSASGGTSTLSTPILQITGGADFSEMFDVGSEEDIEPGTVVSIDPKHAGRLMPSTTAYDLKVAGIVSGAGGVATGMTMGHDGTIADGEHPVALSGRVYCFVDATDHGIEPGDMLTTSDTPGHAMKVIDRDRAQGAIIGKAMTSLEQGETGLVLVLVTLQ